MHKFITTLLLSSVSLSISPFAIYAKDENFGKNISATVKAERHVLVEEQEQEMKDLKEQFREMISSRVGELKKKIGNRVFLRDATINSLGSNSLNVAADGKNYVINIGNETKLRRRYFGKAAFAEFQVGQHINVQGLYTDDANTTIAAKFIRDLSIMKRHGVFIGIVKTVSGNLITLDTIHRGIQQVTISGSTKIVNRKMVTIPQSDVVVGHRIRVKGMWDKANNTVTEVTQLKDFSLPVRSNDDDSDDDQEPTKTPTPIGLTSTPTPTRTPTPTVTHTPTLTPTPTP